MGCTKKQSNRKKTKFYNELIKLFLPLLGARSLQTAVDFYGGLRKASVAYQLHFILSE
jgi:hypothetical protein